MKVSAAIAVAVVIGLAGIYAATKQGDRSAVNEPTFHDIKSQARQISFESLARKPARNVGEAVVFRGEVVQVLNNDQGMFLRVNVTEGERGFWEDTLWVDYPGRAATEQRVLEKDVVRFWGRFVGIKSYKAESGQTVQMPHVRAEVIENAAAMASIGGCQLGRADYAKLFTSMDYSNVERTLGCPGRETSRFATSGRFGTDSVTYNWHGAGDARISATFQSDSLVAKRQVGLN